MHFLLNTLNEIVVSYLRLINHYSYLKLNGEIIAAPSEPPRNFFCKQGGDQEIEATWETPVESSWNGNLQGYVLYYKVQNLPSIPMSEKKVEGANVHTAVIGSLVPFKEYAVRIAAYNEEGVGVMSNPFLVWTREGRPTAAPSNVVPQTVNSTTIKLQWDPPYPGEIYGNNLGYMVQLWQNEVLVRSDFVPSHSENLEGRQEYYVGNLAKFKWYNFTIACRTSPGLGPFSSPVAQQTDEDGESLFLTNYSLAYHSPVSIVDYMTMIRKLYFYLFRTFCFFISNIISTDIISVTLLV